MLTLIRCPFHSVFQWHVKDPGHSTKSAGGRLHLETYTPLTQRNRSVLPPTLLLLCLYRSASNSSTPLPDTSVHPRTHAPSVFFSSKLSHPVKEHSPSQGQLNGIYCLMNSDTPNLLLHLKQLPKPISSDLPTNNNGSEQTFFTRACFSVTGCQGHANHFYSKCC